MENEKITCEQCGNKFYYNGKGSWHLCDNCKLLKTPRIYFRIAIFIIISGIIVGILSGAIFQIPKEITTTYSKTPRYENSFNTFLMITCWIGSSLLSIPVFAIGSILHRLNLIINKKENR